MTVTLSPELEARLASKAKRLGMSTTEYASQLLEHAAPDDQEARKSAAIALLRSWVELGDEDEQRETFEVIRTGLNAHHSSDRLIYP